MAATRIQRPIISINRERSPHAAVADRHSIELDERDIRVDDYINDKLQTTGDFDNLDSLIASVETQRAQLQDQVILHLNKVLISMELGNPLGSCLQSIINKLTHRHSSKMLRPSWQKPKRWLQPILD
jgi:hypothetical protein